MSWKFNSSHINSLTVSNLRADVTSDEFFQKTFYGLFTAGACRQTAEYNNRPLQTGHYKDQ